MVIILADCTLDQADISAENALTSADDNAAIAEEQAIEAAAQPMQSGIDTAYIAAEIAMVRRKKRIIQRLLPRNPKHSLPTLAVTPTLPRMPRRGKLWCNQ